MTVGHLIGCHDVSAQLGIIVPSSILAHSIILSVRLVVSPKKSVHYYLPFPNNGVAGCVVVFI